MPVEDSVLDATYLRKLKVADLRDELTARSLDASGTKQVMTERLLDWKAKQDDQAANKAPAAAAGEEATPADTPAASTDTPMIDAAVEKSTASGATPSAAAAPAVSPPPAAPAAAAAAVAEAPAAAAATTLPMDAAPVHVTRPSTLEASATTTPAAPPAAAKAASAPAVEAEPPRRTIKLTRKPAPTPEEEEAAAATAAKRQKLAETTAAAAAAAPMDDESLQKLAASLPAPVAKPAALSGSAEAAATTPRGTAGALKRRTSETTSEQSAPSSSIRVDGFKRPITAAQIESLLRGFGPTKSISIPFVKNLALVTFESSSVAARALDQLNGMTAYPDASHSEVLTAKWVPEKEVEDAANRSKAIVGAVRTPTAAPSVKPDPRAAAVRAAEETRRREAEISAQARADEEMKQSAGPAAASTASVTTISTGRRVITLKTRQADRDGSGRDAGPTGFRIEKRYDDAEEDAPMAADEEPPTLELDELFRKTVFKPALYFLPCTADEIERKVKRRAAEEDRRQNQRARSRSRERSRGRR